MYAFLTMSWGIRKYKRIGDSVSAKLVTEAAEVSYAKSAEIVTDGAVSRQSVRNHILKLSNLEKGPKWNGKKAMKGAARVRGRGSCAHATTGEADRQEGKNRSACDGDRGKRSSRKEKSDGLPDAFCG